jgi:hypothetical protein
MAQIQIEIEGVDNATPMLDKMAKRMDTLLLLADKSGKQVGSIMNQPLATPTGAPEKLIPGGMVEEVNRARAAVDGVTESVGMSRREWRRTGTEAVFYLTSIAGNAGAMSKELAGSARVVTELGQSFIFGGGVGVTVALVGTAISAIVSQMQAAEKAAQELRDKIIAPFKEMRQEIDALANLKGIDKLAADMGVSAEALRNYTKGGQEAYAQTVMTTEARKFLALKTVDLANAEKEMARAKKESEANPTFDLRAYYEQTKQKVTDLRTEIGILTVAETESNQIIQSGIEMNNLAAAAASRMAKDDLKNRRELDDYAARHKAGGLNEVLGKQTDWAAYGAAINMVHDEIDKVTQSLHDAALAYAKARQQFAMGLVEKALTPTDVTDEDMKLAQQGKYLDKWDEFRRRAEAVAKGTSALSFGIKFDADLKALGMSAEEAARKFKDFSLFADPKNLKLVNWQSMADDVAGQLLGLAGKANLMQEAIQKAFSSMSDPQKAALAKLGIKSWDDAFKALMPDAKNMQKEMTDLRDRLAKLQDADTKLKIAKADDFDKVIKDASDLVKNAFPPEMESTVWIQYKMGAPTDTGKGKDNGRTPGTISPGDSHGRVGGMAEGGVGILSHDTLIQAHAGEGYWFSGLNWDVPAPGAGDGGVKIGQMIVNNQLDAERAAQRIARAMKKRR